MQSNSLIAALAAGVQRPLGLRAQLSSWLGVPIHLTNGEFWERFAGSGSFTGKPVSVDNALQLTTVWACVRLISQTLATLPLGFYLRNPNGSRTSATKHGLYDLLHNQPNADMTAVVFWEVVVASLLIRGNAYVEIIRSAGQVISLHFLHPARVTPRRLKSGAYAYQYIDNEIGTTRDIAEASMMHITAFSLDGRMGISPISYGVNVMGTAIETDRASAETFQNAMRSPGILKMNRIMPNKERDELRAHIKKVSAEGGVMVVENGTGFEPMSFNPHDSELLESRRWNVEELCRWFLIDPAMVGHGGKDSNWGTGLEQKMIWFLTFTLRHWCVRIEQQVRKSLLTPVERINYFAEFAIEGLLRADSASRAAFYSTMEQNGNMTRDEIRQKENLPPMGGNAAVLTVQSNMIPLDMLGQKEAGEASAVRDAMQALLGIKPEASKE